MHLNRKATCFINALILITQTENYKARGKTQGDEQCWTEPFERKQQRHYCDERTIHINRNCQLGKYSRYYKKNKTKNKKKYDFEFWGVLTLFALRTTMK